MNKHYFIKFFFTRIHAYKISWTVLVYCVRRRNVELSSTVWHDRVSTAVGVTRGAFWFAILVRDLWLLVGHLRFLVTDDWLLVAGLCVLVVWDGSLVGRNRSLQI